MKKTIFKIVSILCLVVLLTSCGAVGKNIKADSPETSPEDTTEKRDTFVPLHPPVVVPHTWSEVSERPYEP